MRLKGRRFSTGAIRIEYLIAASVCAALLIGMTAVLLRFSNMKAMSSAKTPMIASRVGQEPERPSPTPTVRVEPTRREEPRPPTRTQEVRPQESRPTQRPKVIVTEVPDPSTPSTPSAPTKQRGGSTAYPSGEPRSIPPSGRTRIEAENYDLGGEGVGYHDTTPENSGGTYRPDESVDISLSQDTEGDHAVSFIRHGEWLNFTIRVQQSGAYRIRFRAARKEPGEARLRIYFDGVDKTGEITVPNTGEYTKFTTTDAGVVELAAGEQTMRVEMVTDDFNLNWIELVSADAAISPSNVVRVTPIETEQPKPAQPGSTQTPTQAQVSANVRTVTEENFNEVKVGGRPADQNWTWSTSGSVSVQQAPGGTDRCLRLVDVSRTSDCWTREQFAAQKESLNWSGRVRFSSISDEFGISLMEGEKKAVIIYTLGGEIGYEDGAGKWHALTKFEANTWYSLRIEANIKDDTFKFLVDNVQAGDSQLKFRNAVNEINAWVVGTSPQLVGTMYVDDVKIEGR